ncbi:putative RNA recognition domain-containing protein [Rosellinia necatrix]|uniref:Putative RNA recognition domain-containing protein n=1 Tax=Rosellinia necatrix TaxID=77044 RepID=A0A1W2TPA2_ROSNE|nr:putative RNA recognition domain-containing protein [Rosellinia necatrix]
MDYQSPSRDGRNASRSPTPPSRYSASPSPRRRRYSSASPPPAQASNNNGNYRSPESRSPSRGRGESRSPLRGSTKIVVEKLSKTINEEHLYEIFGQYGTIRDLDLPMSRQFGHNRGTAYILYVNEADAEAAIASMHEATLDGAIINVSIVLPRRKFDPSPPTASRGANIDPRNPGPSFRGGPGRGAGGGGSGRGSGFGGTRGNRSPQRPGRSGRDNFDTYRPRSYSRSRSPPSRRNRSRSESYGSRSRSPPRRRGGRRESHDNYDVNRERRRSPSYDSERGRSRTRSPERPHR